MGCICVLYLDDCIGGVAVGDVVFDVWYGVLYLCALSVCFYRRCDMECCSYVPYWRCGMLCFIGGALSVCFIGGACVGICIGVVGVGMWYWSCLGEACFLKVFVLDLFGKACVLKVFGTGKPTQIITP